jgi:hypothetical protein
VNSDPIISTPTEEVVNPSAKKGFDVNVIRKYPRSNRKVAIEISPYKLSQKSDDSIMCQSIHIAPAGMEFQCNASIVEGSLLKIMVAIPDYWIRKQKLVEYSRIDAPDKFSVLAKVVKTEDLGKRGKKKLVTVQTVNMDEVDELVLKAFLQDG